MRREPSTRPEYILALAVAEIDRIKSILARVTDGRVLVIDTGTTVGGNTTPPTEAGAHTLYGVKHSRALLLTDGGGLTLDFEQGQVWVGGSFFSIAAGSLVMADDTTNYVFVNVAGAVADNTTGFPEGSIPLGTVVTVAGDITTINDRRSYLLPGASSGGFPHNADQISDDDGDTLVEVEQGADDDTIRFTAATVVVGLVGADGQWQLPVVGSGAGILIGGDALWYRSAADIWRTPDSVIIDGTLTGGVIFLREQADADADVAGQGQIWVNTATPNELFFTDDAGADHQLGTVGTHSIWTHAEAVSGTATLNQLDNNYSNTSIGSTSADGTGYWSFRIPSDFGTLTKAVVSLYSNTTGTLRYRVAASFDEDGVARATTTDSIAATDRAMIVNQLDEIDITAALTGLAADDLLGIAFTREGSHANDTINALRVLGIAIEYTPA